MHVWVDDKLLADPSWSVYTSTETTSLYAVLVHGETGATVKIRIDDAPSRPPAKEAKPRPEEAPKQETSEAPSGESTPDS